MEGLLDILSGGTLGALVGTIGSYVNKKLEIKQRAQELSHELSVREMAIREMAAEQTHEINMADKEMQRSKVEGEVEIEKGELAGWVQSMKATGSSIMDTLLPVAFID